MRILKGQPIRRQVVAITGALLVPFVIAAVWTAKLTRIEHVDELRDQAGSVAATAGAYLDQFLTGLDSMASALTRHPAVMELDREASNRLFEAVLRDAPGRIDEWLAFRAGALAIVSRAWLSAIQVEAQAPGGPPS